MFRLEIFLDDKQVPGVIRDIAGRVHDIKVQPVVNAEVKGGKLAPKGDGSIVSLFKDWVGTRSHVDTTSMMVFLKAIGRGAYKSGVYKVVRQLIEAGVLGKPKGRPAMWPLKGRK